MYSIFHSKSLPLVEVKKKKYSFKLKNGKPIYKDEAG